MSEMDQTVESVEKPTQKSEERKLLKQQDGTTTTNNNESTAAVPNESTGLDTKEEKNSSDDDEAADAQEAIFDLEKQHENLEKQILHSLISLLMKFMVSDDQIVINEDRVMMKQQVTTKIFSNKIIGSIILLQSIFN